MTTDAIKEAVVAAYGIETASALARRLGISKGTVCGLWSRRPRGETAKTAKPKRAPARIKVSDESPPAPAAPSRLSFSGAAAATLALGSRCCRWPIGEPNEQAFRFCAEVSIEGKPYCPEHARKAGGGMWNTRQAA